MLNFDLEDLWQEITAADKLRTDKLGYVEQVIDQYASGRSPGWSRNSGVSWPENHAFEFIGFMLPKVSFDQPRVSTRSRRQTSAKVLEETKMLLATAVQTGLLDEVSAREMLELIERPSNTASAVEHGLNRWIIDSNYQRTLDRVAYDFLISWGVIFSTLGVMPGKPENRWPISERLSPTRYVVDPTALHCSEARWKGHWSLEDRDMLMSRARNSDQEGWKPENIKRLIKASTETDNHAVQRDDVKVYTIWIPEYSEEGWPGDDEGFNGAVAMVGSVDRGMGSGDASAFVREPQPYFGPPWGPYTEIGAYTEPDSPYPLSPIAATFQQVQELNRHARSMSKKAAQYKRAVLVSTRNPALAAKLKSAEDEMIIPIHDELFDKNQIAEIEVGGITPQQLSHYTFFRERLNRMSGLEDAQRGEVSGEGTATEHAIADASLQLRVQYLQKKFADAIEQDLRTKAWYMVMDSRISFPLGADASEKLNQLQPIFVGGIDEDEDFTFEDLEIEVDAYSMSRTSEALTQRRILEAFNMITTVAPLMSQTPWVDWREMVRRIGDSLNMPDLVDIIDAAQLDQFSQQGMLPTTSPESQTDTGRSVPEAQPSGNSTQRPAMASASMRGREAAENSAAITQ